MSTQSVSSQTIDQRVRNRVIEYLEMLANYENDPPPWDINETVNQWEDWIVSPATRDQFPGPVYSELEALQLVEVDTAWTAFADAPPSSIQSDQLAKRCPEWVAFITAAKRALECLNLRGRLPEDDGI